MDGGLPRVEKYRQEWGEGGDRDGGEDATEGQSKLSMCENVTGSMLLCILLFSQRSELRSLQSMDATVKILSGNLESYFPRKPAPQAATQSPLRCQDLSGYQSFLREHVQLVACAL